MINITIVGTGNVAFHLSEIFLEKEGINLMEICGRKNNLPSYFNDKINIVHFLLFIDFIYSLIAKLAAPSIGKIRFFLSLKNLSTAFFWPVHIP